MYILWDLLGIIIITKDFLSFLKLKCTKYINMFKRKVLSFTKNINCFVVTLFIVVHLIRALYREYLLILLPLLLFDSLFDH